MKINTTKLLTVLTAQAVFIADICFARQSSYIIARTTEANSGGPWYLTVPEQENPELGIEIHLRPYSPWSNEDLENQMRWWYGRKEPGRSNTYSIHFEPNAFDNPENSKDDLEMKINANLDHQSPRMFSKDSDIEVDWNIQSVKDSEIWSPPLFTGNEEFLSRFLENGGQGNANEIMIKEVAKSSKDPKGRFYACDEGVGLYLAYEYEEDPRETCKPVTLFFRKSKLDAPVKDTLYNVEEDNIITKRNQLKGQRASIMQRLGFENVYYANAPRDLKRLVDKILAAGDRNPLNAALGEEALRKTHYSKIAQIKKKLAENENKLEQTKGRKENKNIEVGSKRLLDLDEEESISHRRRILRSRRLPDDEEDPFNLEPKLEKQVRLDEMEITPDPTEPALQNEEKAATERFNWIVPDWIKHPELMEMEFLKKWHEKINDYVRDIQPIIMNMQNKGDQYALSAEERKKVADAFMAIKHWNSLGNFLSKDFSASGMEGAENEQR